ncbi:erythromycin esterase family protein [Terrimonas sp. NA20]|uniref:Erythromycin esterase family protein n=1 Tax=Terrimonas ginsenosidimutans TaxID=2908004 RepID=A0ABS9KP10_9BACT|nr:erythromycin esterase family protein [Terrimonas ginsenosidimutans]MCG2614063.1 erythromycin esterase family protein [Terrimonas ginsenosidimutans]
MKKGMVFILMFALSISSGAQQKITSPGQFRTYPVTSDSNSAFLPFKDIFAAKDIIGLGEATHGTQEFMTLRIQLLKFLITECGYRNIVLEASFGNMLFIDRYCTTADGNADSLFHQLGYWAFHTEEFKDFIEWVKKFNRNITEEKQVHLSGMDIHNLMDGIDYLYSNLSQLSIDKKEKLESILLPAIEKFGRGKTIVSGSASPETLEAFSIISKELKEFLRQDTSLSSRLTTREFGIWKMCSDNLAYAIDLPRNGMFYRDSCMFENTRQLISLNHQKTVIWGHNHHIGRYDSLTRDPNLRMMIGERLHLAYKDQYYPIGFLFNSGSFLALEEKLTDKGRRYPYLSTFTFPPNKSHKVSNALATVSKYPIFVRSEENVHSTLSKPQPFYVSGSIYGNKWVRTAYLTPTIVFSAFIFVPQTSAIKQLDDALHATKK